MLARQAPVRRLTFTRATTSHLASDGNDCLERWRVISRATGTTVSSDDESSRERPELCSRATTSHLASDRSLALEQRRVISRATGALLSSNSESSRERQEPCSRATTSHLASDRNLALEQRRVISRVKGGQHSSGSESGRVRWTCNRTEGRWLSPPGFGGTQYQLSLRTGLRSGGPPGRQGPGGARRSWWVAKCFSQPSAVVFREGSTRAADRLAFVICTSCSRRCHRTTTKRR